MITYVDHENEAVSPGEMFQAMAESLMTKETFYTVPTKEDAPPIKFNYEKPKPDMFYRNLPLVSKRIPGNIPQRRCTCMFLCTGAVATIKCSSCAALDARGLGYYCQLCMYCDWTVS